MVALVCGFNEASTGTKSTNANLVLHALATYVAGAEGDLDATAWCSSIHSANRGPQSLGPIFPESRMHPAGITVALRTRYNEVSTACVIDYYELLWR